MRAAALLVLAVPALCLVGCARAPRPGLPVDRDRLEDIAAAIACAGTDGPLRASGSGELALGGERREFGFALVYDPPAWLRADLRPPLGSLSGAATLSALLSGDTLTVYAPSRNAWFGGRLRDAVRGLDRVRVAPFLVGRPDPGLLLRLSRPRVAREGPELVLSGDVYGRYVSVAVDTAALAISAIVVALPDGARLSVRYHLAGSPAPHGAPGGTSLLYTDERGAVDLHLTFERLDPLDAVKRSDLSLEIPPTASRLRWEDVEPGRKP